MYVYTMYKWSMLLHTVTRYTLANTYISPQTRFYSAKLMTLMLCLSSLSIFYHMYVCIGLMTRQWSTFFLFREISSINRFYLIQNTNSTSIWNLTLNTYDKYISLWLINEYICIFTFIICREKNYKFRKEQSTSGLVNIRKKEMRVAVDIFILKPNHIND